MAFQFLVIVSGAGPADGGIIGGIIDGEILEGRQPAFFNGIEKPGLIGHIVVAEAEHIAAVHAFRSGGHAEKEAGCEMIDHLLIGPGCGMMELINDDIGEVIRGEGVEDFGLREGLDGGKDRGAGGEGVLSLCGGGVAGEDGAEGGMIQDMAEGID